MFSPQKGNVNYGMVMELANATVKIWLCINVSNLYIMHVKIIQCFRQLCLKKNKEKKFQGPNSKEHFFAIIKSLDNILLKIFPFSQ